MSGPARPQWEKEEKRRKMVFRAGLHVHARSRRPYVRLLYLKGQNQDFGYSPTIVVPSSSLPCDQILGIQEVQMGNE